MYMKATIQQLDKEDLDSFFALIRVFEEVFEMQDFCMPPHEHLRKLLHDPDFIVYVAHAQQKVVGGLTAYTLQQYYSEKPLAYIYDLAVLKPYQRKGIGKALIQALNSYCRAEAYQEVFVQADEIDTYALDFYRSTHPSEEEHVRHFYYNLEPKV